MSEFEDYHRNETNERTMKLTLLFSKASAKHWKPLPRILLSESSNTVSVYMKSYTERNGRTKREKQMTVLDCKASAKD